MCPQRIRDVLVAEELAAQAGTEGTPDLFLSDSLQPIIFGPQRPPLAASGYYPGTMGTSSAAVALNTSHVGIFVSGTNNDSIIRVNNIKIVNVTVNPLIFTLRRIDDGTGFTILGLVPAYISAGNPASGGVFSAVRSNTVAAQGDQMASIRIEANDSQDIVGPWIVNNGILAVAGFAVNEPVEAVFSYEHWPSIRRQPIPA